MLISLVMTAVCLYHFARNGNIVQSESVAGSSVSTGTVLTSSTKMPSWKMFTYFPKDEITTVIWELDPDFTTDLNMLVNADVKKNQSQPIVDYVMIDDMKPMNAYCRCWRSKKFPLCDGRHLWWNNRTGDNVGPVFIKDRHLLNDSKEFYNFMCKIRRRK
uniref:CDGSH iron-sulfur domain-containing protein 2 homologue n=1 Tax=Cacopsylla melanoneura TaxID=428564 RepID=A0A8D9ENR3_9HEMI